MRHHHFLDHVSAVLLLSLSILTVGGINGENLWAQDTGQNPPNTSGTIQQVAPQGMSQEEWDQELAQCNELWAEMKRREGLSADQNAQLPSISYNAIENCRGMMAPVRNQYQPSGPTSVDPVLPVPVASPTPPSDLDSNASPAASSSSPSQFNGISVGQSPIGPPIPLKISPSSVSEPAASDSLLDLSPNSQSNPPSSSSFQVNQTADAAPALSSPGTLGPISGSNNSGDDVNACTEGMPPNIAADVNGTQQAEFTNLRLSVYTKETSPAYSLALATGSFTNPESQLAFWCTQDGNTLPNCLNSTLFFSDADIVWDRVSNQWFATAVPIIDDPITKLPTPAGGIFFAASTGADATDQPGNWHRWNIDNTTYPGLICPTAGYNTLDQPLIGFSKTYLAIDTTCFSSSGPGQDTAFVIPISNINSVPTTLGIVPVSHTLPFRSTPSRDRSSAGYNFIWFLSTFLPAAPTTAAPVVSWTTADNSNPPILTSGSTTLAEAVGSTKLADIPQPNCPTNPTGYNCTIRGNDSRIRAVDLQVRPTDGTAYLAAAFTYAAASGGYILNWFVQPAANPQAIVPYVVSSNDGTLLDFDTITLDPDLDAFMTATDLSPVAYPAVQWYQPRFYPDSNQVVGLGEGYLQYSGNNAFTGQSVCDPDGPALQRWGDFNSAGWDYSLASPNGKQGVFWAAVEYTNGTSYPNGDQSSEWWNISDPTPYYVNATQNSTYPCTSGKACTLTLTVPSNTDVGDLLVANLGISENASKLVTLPNSSWSLLSFGNLSAQKVSSSTPCTGTQKPIKDTMWAAVHIYQNGDPSQFSFSDLAKNYAACGGTITPGMGGVLASYRDAGHVEFPHYSAFGYGSTTNNNQFTFGPFSGPQLPPGTMIIEPDFTGLGGTAITGVAGNPSLTLESPPSITLPVYDAIINAAGESFGAYVSSSNCTPSNEFCGFIDIGVALPSY